MRRGQKKADTEMHEAHVNCFNNSCEVSRANVATTKSIIQVQDRKSLKEEEEVWQGVELGMEKQDT